MEGGADESARKHGLRFGVSEHLERACNRFNTDKGSNKEVPLAGVPYDDSPSGEVRIVPLLETTTSP